MQLSTTIPGGKRGPISTAASNVRRQNIGIERLNRSPIGKAENAVRVRERPAEKAKHTQRGIYRAEEHPQCRSESAFDVTGPTAA